MAHTRNILVSVIFRIVVSVVLLIVAIAIFAFLFSTAPKPGASDASAIAPRVEVMIARAVPVQRQWDGFGTAEVMDSADVPARVSATVIERPEHIRAGQRIDSGQLIVRLDDSDFQKQVEISTQAIGDLDAQLERLAVEEQAWTRRAQLAAEEVRLAQTEFERIRSALERDAARQREVDQAARSLMAVQQTEVATREELDKIAPRRTSLQAQRGREEANLRLARLNVERSRIVSPIDGLLAEIDVDLGENLAIGQRVARVVNLTRIEVPLLLPASARPFVAVGDAVSVMDAGASPRTWSATVARISPIDDESTRTMRIYAEVSQSDDDPTLLPPGRFVQGIVQTSRSETRWVVPRRAISGGRILTIEDSRIRSQNIEIDFNMQAAIPELGLPDQQWVVLKNPLPEQTMVVVEGSRALAEGAAVVPIVNQPSARSARAEVQSPVVVREDESQSP